MKAFRIALLLPLAAVACADAPENPMVHDVVAPFGLQPNLSEWSEATAAPFAAVNTPDFTEGCPFVTRTGVLYFASNRTGGEGKLDLYVSHWDANEGQWGEPHNIRGLNTGDNEQCPLVLNNGKEMIFVSDRADGVGGLDLWIARRDDHRNDLGWHSPVNLTAANSDKADFGPGGYEEEDGTIVVYFNSNRAGPAHDLYVTRRPRGGTFSVAVAAAGLNTFSEEQFAALTKDGREIFFSSNRRAPGASGSLDLWTASRQSTSHPWSTPINLGSTVNSASAEGRSAISWDGMTLYFHSNRGGGLPDLFQTTRTRQTPARGN
jgi:hypothetical protein